MKSRVTELIEAQADIFLAGYLLTNLQISNS